MSDAVGNPQTVISSSSIESTISIGSEARIVTEVRLQKTQQESHPRELNGVASKFSHTLLQVLQTSGIPDSNTDYYA